MQKDCLNYLILESRKFAKKHELFDIVLYGSNVKGKLKANDLDIILIFREKQLKARTEIAQDFKNLIEKDLNPDIKTINLIDFFEKDFLARQSIFIEGYSLIYNEKFAKRFGFEGYSLFTYNLKNLNHNEKTKFIYALIGRRIEKGIIKKTGAVSLGKGAVKIPIEESIIFEDFLKRWNIDYKTKNILEAR